MGDVKLLVEMATVAESAGWDGVFLWDHLQYREPVPIADTWVTLSAVAAATETIRLGPLVTPLARRRPWKVAREALTLDHLSDGRLILGVGLGIDFWGEFSSYSGEVDTDSERAALVDDGIEILDRLWSGARVDFEGDRLAVTGAQYLPTPVQQPRIPIWSAALWPAAQRGPITRAARCDGVMPFTGQPMTPKQANDVRDTVQQERGNDSFDLCVWGDPQHADEYEAAGVTWLVQGASPEDPAAAVLQWIAAGPPS